MISFTERPRVDVLPQEYHRLLGYPRDHTPSPRAVELAGAARAWYDLHGHPWIYAREDDAAPRRDPRAHSAVLVAVSAGPELEAESQRLWREEKPDEYFFLETYGSAVVERLVALAGARLWTLSEPERIAVLPHYSPGYPEWDIAQQPMLRSLYGELPGPLECLESGALRPRKSQLAVFPLTRHTEGVRPPGEIPACQSCSYGPCEFRRAPHQVNVKALRRWAAERLSLAYREDGTIDAVFRYDGTTCTNTGHPITFDYRVLLGPRAQGHPILEQHCVPAPGHNGYMLMCRYLDGRDQLMTAIAHEKPLAGRPLHEALSWTRPTLAAACLCEADSREHKWGLVLETIQYALDQSTPARRD